MQRGSARKRGTTWTAYFYVNSASGRRRQRSKGGFSTKREAQAYLTSTLAALQRNELIEPTKLTFGEYLVDRWLPIVCHSLRPSTWDSYKRTIERHVIPTLGGVSLQALTAGHLDELYAQLLANGHCRGGGLAPKTVRYLHTTLQKALRDAVRKQLVARNVAHDADAPKLRASGHREMRTWSAEEVRIFLEATVEHRLHAAFMLAATTGMRRGEVLGLRWADIDIKAARLSVRQTVLSINYRLEFGTPKTARGRRSIALDSATVAVLGAHRRRQAEERLLVGSGYSDHDLVFAQLSGAPIHPDYFTQCFERIVKRLGMRLIRLHICVTPTPLWDWQPAYRQRSCRIVLVTPPLPSRKTSTCMPYRSSRPMQPNR